MNQTAFQRNNLITPKEKILIKKKQEKEELTKYVLNKIYCSDAVMIKMFSKALWSQKVWIHLPNFPLANCVTLGKLIYNLCA